MSRPLTTASPALHVALASDRAYLPWVATAILSAVQQTSELPVVVHLLHASDVLGHDIDRLTLMVEAAGASIAFYSVDAMDLGPLPLAVQAHGGAISCARFLLPELLPEIDRVIYLDADTLTLSSLEPLWRVPLDELAMGAVRNVVEPAMRPRLLQLGVPDPKRYLNSGLLLMNLDLMRREGSSAALLQYIHERGDELLWVDQDALNVVLGESWYELHPRWNVQNSFWDWEEWASQVHGSDRLSEATHHPAVLHFEGPSLCKPWHYLCEHPYVGSYRAVLQATPWASEPPTDRTVLTRAIRWLPEGRRRAAFLKLQRARARWRSMHR